MAEINGGKFGEGLSVAAINKLIISTLVKNDKDLSTEQARWISSIIGIVFDGYQGAQIADVATTNNYLTHKQYDLMNVELELNKDNPEKTKEILEYWQMIHDVQLNSFLHQYLYSPNGYTLEYAQYVEINYSKQFNTGGVDLKGNPVILTLGANTGVTNSYQQRDLLMQCVKNDIQLVVQLKSLESAKKEVKEKYGLNPGDQNYMTVLAKKYDEIYTQASNIQYLFAKSPKDVFMYFYDNVNK